MPSVPPVPFALPPFAVAAQAPPGPLELLVTYLPMALILLVAWFLLYRPERERAMRQQALLAGLKKNDRVLTASGIYGTIANVDRDADRVLLRIDDSANVKLAVTLSSIAKVLADKADAAAAGSGDRGGDT
jgi:preprotein translocase subunit YajC